MGSEAPTSRAIDKALKNSACGKMAVFVLPLSRYVQPGRTTPSRWRLAVFYMKARWIIVSAAALMLVSPGQALADEALARESGCLECHSADEKAIGPSFPDIAAKYRDDASARDALIEVVKNGGKGNWTEVSHGVPMPPYSGRLSDAEIEQLVDWVLGG